MSNLLFLAVNKSTDWGGSEKLWIYAVQYLIERSENVTVNISIPKRVRYHEKVLSLMREVPVFTRVKRPHFIRRFYCALRGIKHEKLEFIEIVKRSKPCLVVISQGANMDGLNYMKYCFELNIPYITISQSVNEYKWLPYHEVLEARECFVHAIINLFVSNANVAITQRQLGIKLKNTRIVRNPFDVPYDNQLPYPNNGVLKLACVARYEVASKGQDILLDVLSDPKWKLRNIQVNLYGAGSDEALLKDIIKMYNIEDIVFVKGFENPIEIWKENHALVLTSRYEGLPLAVVEAMLCGRVPVVTNVSGNSELLVDGKTGIVAKGANKEEIDKALEVVWNYRDSLEQMGQLAKHSIKQQVSSDPVVALVEIIQDACFKQNNCSRN